MKKVLDNFIKKTPAMLAITILVILLWAIIFAIEFAINQFMVHDLTTILAVVSGISIGSYVHKVKEE